MAVNTSEEYLDELLQAIEPVVNPEQYKESLAAKEAEPKEEPKPVVEAEPKAEAEPMAEPEPVVETEPMAEPEPVVEAEPELVVEAEPMAEPEPVVEAEREPVVEAEPAEIPSPGLNINDFDFVDPVQESPEAEEIEELAMSEDEIEALLNSAKSQASMESPKEEEITGDVSELLKQFSEDQDLSDIQDILDKDEKGEAVDSSILDEPVSAEEMSELLDTQNEKEVKKENKKAAKKKKEKGKGLFGLFSKKKNKKEDEEESEADLDEREATEEDDSDNIDVNDMNVLLAGLAGGDGDNQAGSEETVNGENGASEAVDDAAEAMAAETVDALLKEKEPKAEKKKSLFKRIFDLLTEEFEDEKESVPEASATGITDENKEILEELSKEDKKKKKKFASKKKKGKGAEKPESEDGEDDDESKDKGKGKKKKPKKEKKAKKENADKILEKQKPEKKLPRKRVISIFALCFSILAFILIMIAVIPGIANIKQAKWAFDNEDYQTCYENLYGIDRNEEEEILYQKSAIILSVDRQAKSYLNLSKLGMKLEALDALFEGIKACREVQEKAEELGIGSRITPYEEAFLEKLAEYNLKEADIEEIINYESKVAYTMRLDSIVNGTEFQWQGLGEE